MLISILAAIAVIVSVVTVVSMNRRIAHYRSLLEDTRRELNAAYDENWRLRTGNLSMMEFRAACKIFGDSGDFADP